jgi:hypothetical protein
MTRVCVRGKNTRRYTGAWTESCTGSTKAGLSRVSRSSNYSKESVSFLFFFFTCHLTCYTGRHYSPKLEISPKVTTRSRGPFERTNQGLPFIRAAFTFMRGLIFPFLHNYVKFVRRVARFSVHVGTQNLYVLYASPNQSHIIHLSYKSIRCSCMLE